jgi:hypothetical protein
LLKFESCKSRAAKKQDEHVVERGRGKPDVEIKIGAGADQPESEHETSYRIKPLVIVSVLLHRTRLFVVLSSCLSDLLTNCHL